MSPSDTNSSDIGEVSTARLPPGSGRYGSAINVRPFPAEACSLTASPLTACLAQAFVLPGGRRAGVAVIKSSAMSFGDRLVPIDDVRSSEIVCVFTGPHEIGPSTPASWLPGASRGAFRAGSG